MNLKNKTVHFSIRNLSQRTGLRIRISLIASLFILLTVGITIAITTYQYAVDTLERLSEKNKQTIYQLADNIDGYIEDIRNVATYVYYSADVLAALNAPTNKAPLALLERRRTVEQYLDRVMLLTKKDVVNYFIITGDEIYHGGRMQKNIDYTTDYTQYEWYQKALEEKNTLFLPPHKEQLIIKPSFEVISIVKTLRDISNTDKILGVVKVDLNYSAISNAAQLIDNGDKGGLLILDENQQIIYNSMGDAFFKQFITDDPSQTTYTKQIGDDYYLINQKNINSCGWRIFSASSEKELAYSAVKTIKNSILMATVLAMLATVLLFITISAYLHPLDDLVSMMKQVETGKMDVYIPVTKRNEIGYVINSFNSMIHRLQQMIEEKETLIKRAYSAEMLNTEAQLYALQSQIKPHFLYNILNLFTMQIQMGMYHDAIDSIGKLELILRSQTKWKKSISLKDSFQILDSYLSLQKYRFSDRLAYQLNCDDKLKQKYVIPFILQPIVENAVVHGCENKRGQTLVTVSASEQNDTTVFIVKDTGTGIPEERLREIQNTLSENRLSEQIILPEEEKQHHLGLRNVNNRIKLQYGNEYGLEISSVLGEGSEVIIRLPILSEEHCGNENNYFSR